jgi:hypothetical protein
MRVTVPISLVALAISSAAASAACKQASLAGNWHYLASNVVVHEDLSPVFTYIEDCTFRITATGVARNARCFDGTTRAPTEVPFGNTTRFLVNPDCSIQSTRSDYCFDGITGQIAPNRQVVSGNAVCCLADSCWQSSYSLVKLTPPGAGQAVSTAETSKPLDAPLRDLRGQRPQE